MYKKMIFLVTGLFLTFILQSYYTLTFGQTDTSQENVDLNGIWKRVDSDRFNDTFLLSQSGNEITAIGKVKWYCWDTPDRIEGTQYAPFREVLRGKLVDHTIQGQIVDCFPEERTSRMIDMKSTISADGKLIDIQTTEPNEAPLYEQYEFLSAILDKPLINMHTNKPTYNFKEQVEVSGYINNLIKGVNALFLEVYGPDSKKVIYDDVPINPDGTFSIGFNLNDSANNGTYTAHAAYASASKEIDFEYGVPIGVISVPVVASGIGIAAAAGGGFLLHKHGYFKRIEQLIKSGSQNGQTPDVPVPVVYVGIECGLENPELFEKQTLGRNAIATQDIVKVEQAFSKSVDDILKNRKVIKKVKDDTEFIKWCKEAKENPKKILSKVSDDIINKFLSSISPYFGNLILSELSVESDVTATRDKHKKIRKSVQFNLVPIEPYIEFVLYVNTQRMSSAKFIFTIETNVEVKNLAVNMTSPDTNVEEELQERPKENYDKKISIENLIFAVAVEFSRLKIGPIEKKISPPIIIGTKKVEVKKIGSSHG